ncbi:MAG: dihydroxyacetone kinase subunit L [Chloroflexi bacterium]|nr:dihydroxyacetone kinase subunit L [Chloroflexota bacterium]
MLTKAQLVRWLETSADLFAAQKAYLTELDSAIGDADHGINMARGFAKVAEKLPSVAESDIGNILKTTGMTLMSSVGGASGPLYGTFFMRAGQAAPDQDVLAASDLAAIFEAGLAGLVQRGRAEVGDKTMIDAWTPALAALKASIAADETLLEALIACVNAAEQGVQDSIPLIAKKGRASYLGERSAGHPDPGATSSYYLLKVLLETVKADA